MKGFQVLKIIVLLMMTQFALAQTDLGVITSQDQYQLDGDGQENILTFEFDNVGFDIATGGVTVSFIKDMFVPPSFDFTNAISSDFNCSPNGDNIDCTYNNTSFDPNSPAFIDLGIINQPGSEDIQPAFVVNINDLSGQDGNPGNNNLFVGVEYIAGGDVDLQVVKTLTGGFPNDVDPGDPLSFDITVTNLSSTVDATNVVITDDLGVNGLLYDAANSTSGLCFSSGTLVTCSVSLLAAGDSQNFRIATFVDLSAPIGNRSNTVEVMANENDPFIGNNMDTQDFVVIAVDEADLSLNITPDSPSYTVGDNVNFSLNIQNIMGANAAPLNTVITTTLPNEVVYSSASVNNLMGWQCTHDDSPTGGDVVCDSLGTALAIGANEIINIFATANSPTSTIMTVTANVVSDFDPNSANDFAFGNIEIFAGDADLSLQMLSSTGSYDVGDLIDYEVQAISAAASSTDPSDVTIAMTLPGEVSFVGLDLSGAGIWNCSHTGESNGGIVNCNLNGTTFDSGTSDDFIIETQASSDSTGALFQAQINSAADSTPGNNTANQIDIINGVNADLSIQMNSTSGIYQLGEDILYDIQVDNPVGTGVNPADVEVDFTLPDEVIFQNVNTSNAPDWSCTHDGSAEGGGINCDRSGTPFTAGSSHNFNVLVRTDSEATGALFQAEISSAVDVVVGNNTTSQSDEITAGSADFSVTKTVSGASQNIGDNFTYQLIIENPVTSSLSPSDVVIDDMLPAEVSYVSFSSITDLGTTVNCTHDNSNTGGLFSCDTGSTDFTNGETVVIDITVTAITAGTNIVNTATVETMADPDGVTGNNTASANSISILGPNTTTLNAVKTAVVDNTPVTVVGAGETFSYVLAVENTGGFDAVNVNITDVLPAEVVWSSTNSTGWSCVAGNNIGDVDCTLIDPLSSGATAEIVVEVAANGNPNINDITNQMFVSADNIPSGVNDSTTVVVSSANGQLDINNVNDPVGLNSPSEFVVEFTNTGAVALSGIQLVNELPNGFSFNGFNAPADVSCTNNVNTVTCTTLNNLASGSMINISIDTTSPIVNQANLQYLFTSTVSATELTNDLVQTLEVNLEAIDFTASMISEPNRVSVGESFAHVISIQNSGSAALQEIVSTYNLPNTATYLGVEANDFNCNVNNNLLVCDSSGALGVNSATEIAVNLRVDNFVAGISGVAAIDADGTEQIASTLTSVNPSVADDLSLRKTADVAEIGVNQMFSYVFEVSNIGSTSQTSITLTDQLPAGVVFQSTSGTNWNCVGTSEVVCDYQGTLLSGTQSQLVMEVLSPNSLGDISNTASVSSDQDDNLSNNSSTIGVSVIGGGGGTDLTADLEVTIEATDIDVLNTDIVGWRIKVKNNGPDSAQNVTVTSPLPAGFIAESVDVINGGDCVLLESSLTCSIVELPNNQVSEFLLQGSVTSGFVGVLLNTVQITADSIDENPANNMGMVEVTVSDANSLSSDLTLEINAFSQQIQQGALIPVTLVAKNLGPNNAVNAKISGTVSGLIDEVVFTNSAGWMCQTSNSQFSCVLPNEFMVNSTASIDLQIQTQQVVQQAQPVVLNVMIESDLMDEQPGNNMAGFTNETTRTPTEDEIFAIFQNSVGDSASDTVIQSIRNVSSYCARSYFMAIEGLCEEFIEGATPENGGAIINAMEELTPNEVAAQSNSAAEIMASQFQNVSSRLSQLRGGGGAGLSVSGLNGRYGNESIPIGMLAYLNQGEEEEQAVNNINDFVSPWGFFVNGSISMGERDATGQELGFDFDTFGLTAGVDYRFSPTKVAGLALGYANFDSEIEDEAEMQSTSFTLTGYGSFYIKDNFYVDARISYGNPDFEQKRRINFAVDDILIDRVASGQTDSNQYSAAMSVGYHFNKNAWNITPNASIRYVRTTIDAFQESGAGGFNFAFGEQEVTSMVWSVGASISRAISLKNGIISPQFDFNFSRETENDGGLLEARFINAPDDEIFWIGTDEPDRTYGNAGLGLVFIGANGKQAYVNYRSIFGLEGFSRGTINVGARFEF